MNDNNTDKLISALSSTQATLIAVNQKLGELNDEIKGASKSSENVSSALNNLTRTGLWVAGAGVLAALGHLILELWKYIHT